MADQDLYRDRGVSSTKDAVHAAVRFLEKGLFPGAFCKIVPDFLTGDPDYCLVIHADGAGTKVVAAYLAWLEGAEYAWDGIPLDSLHMNFDDEGCVGAYGPYGVVQTINRNTFKIPDEVISRLINGCQQQCDELTRLGFPAYFASGETADVPDCVRTIVVDNTVICRMRRADVIDASRMRPGDTIVGFASAGQAKYESRSNSGVGSNGLTNGRHDVLSHHYAQDFPEAFAPEMKPALVYRGKYRLSDRVPDSSFTVGELLLSPTRTNLPIMRDLAAAVPREDRHGFIHCSGGAQMKIGRFGEPGNCYRKDNPFPLTPEFDFLRRANPSMTDKEFWRCFNGSHRFEAVVPSQYVSVCEEIGKKWGVATRVVGQVERSKSGKREVHVRTASGKFVSYTEGIDWR